MDTMSEDERVLHFGLTRHDGLIENGFPACVAGVRALLTDRAPIGEEEQVAVALNPVLALCTTEAVYGGSPGSYRMDGWIEM